MAMVRGYHRIAPILLVAQRRTRAAFVRGGAAPAAARQNENAPRACDRMGAIVHTITVKTQAGSYPVSIGSGLTLSLGNRLRKLFGSSRKSVYVLTSPEIWALWGKRLLASFAPQQPVVIFLPAGERYKRLAQIERLASELLAAGADRSSLLLAFGGGVVGDVGGFLAAIYMRGIDYVQVPTTFLAEVDSSVGGKTGVNLSAGKNLVGSFHHPRAVFADIDLLGTLPLREYRAGLYESVKAGLIRDAALFRYMEANRALIDRREPAALEKIVAASVRMKAEVVGLDERESGLRMILNFGHTIGHAIEAMAGFGALLHGEAIAWGMLIALEASRARGWLKAADAERAGKLIRALAPPPPPRWRGERLLAAASSDKKNRAGVRRFVLLKGIGGAVVTEDVTDSEVLAAIESILGPRAREG
jgi:3-dehydroquinate synthase